MSNISIELSNNYNLIRKNTEFSFISEIINSVNNYNYKKTAIATLSGECDTQQSYIWTALSNVATEISERFSENIDNFIDNISNVDLCKIASLQSMMSMLGISYSIFDKLTQAPEEIIDIMNVLSIKKEYLINSTKVKSLMSKLLHEQISSNSNVDINGLSSTADELTKYRLSSIISTDSETYSLSTILSGDNISVDYNFYLDNEKLDNYTSAIYAYVLSTFCFLPYSVQDTGKIDSQFSIYKYLSSNIILSNFALENTNSLQAAKILEFRLKYNIPKTFDTQLETDKIENGVKELDNYSEYEQYLINEELSYRAQALSAVRLDSRYQYYRQQKVREYFKFVENEYANYLSVYLNSNKYNIDNNYIVVKNNNSIQLLNPDDLKLHTEYIDYVARILADITNSIRDIREQLKTQVQKNFMKGTKQHIEYIICEYIKNNAYPMVKKLGFKNIPEYNISDNIVNINEYIDSTEYFNISTEVDQLSDNVNLRYWHDKSNIYAVGPYNDTNIFKKPTRIKSAIQNKFSDEDVQFFYKQTLQTRFETNITNFLDDADDKNYLNLADIDQNKHLSAFLYNVYNSAADTTYQDISGNISCNLDFVYDKIKIKELPKASSDVLIENLNKIMTSLDVTLDIKDKIKDTPLEEIYVATYNQIITSIKNSVDYSNKKIQENGIDIRTITISADDWRKYKTELYKKYSGTYYGTESFYHIKNQRHPSYQIHPYIRNFVNTLDIEYPIQNIANIITENIADLLVNNIDYYIDDNGYLINEWNNQLNSNADYVTKYEKSSNKDSTGVVNPVIDYDGIFYPTAVDEFLAGKVYTYNDVSYSFIDALIGVNDENGNNVCINPWYKGLNLSLTERKNIAYQLKIFKTEISNIAKNTAVDIYRYGKDYYGNSYSLVKKYSNVNDINNISKLDPDYKFSTFGTIWMKLKNHPISFPMINNNSINQNGKNIEDILPEDYELSASQIKYINKIHEGIRSTLSFNNAKYETLNVSINGRTFPLQLPAFKDFTISNDKTELMFITSKKDSNKDFAIHTNVKKIFYNIPYNRYFYYLINDSYTSDEEIPILQDGYNISGFYNFDTNIGVVQIYNNRSSNTITDISVYLPYWKKYEKLDSNKINKELRKHITIENCKPNTEIAFDITNKKRFTIAYIQNDIDINTQMTDYFGKDIKYPGDNSCQNTNAYFNRFTNAIKTLDFKFDDLNIVQADYIREYLPYNDMGFVPLYKKQSDDSSYWSAAYINDIAHSPIYDNGFIKRGILKCNLIGKPTAKTGNDHGIFFKYVVPIRMHERYSTDKKEIKLANVNQNVGPRDVQAEKYNSASLYALNYLSARYSEISNDVYAEAMKSIYDPYRFEQAIQHMNLSARIDENYAEIGRSAESIKYHKAEIDMFKDIPYFWWSNGKSITDYIELYNPGSTTNNHLTVNNQDEYILCLSGLNGEDKISVSWICTSDNLYGGKTGIKLDFNTQFYNNDKFGNTAYHNNYFNWKHSFLNLDKPGDAGYLQTFSNDGKYSQNIYYIKNISDEKPKFLISLSANVNYIPPVDPTEIELVTEDGTEIKYDTVLGSTNAETEVLINPKYIAIN